MGGGSLKWGPPLVKRDSDYRFLPRIIYPLKWVGGSEGLAFLSKLTKSEFAFLSKLTTSGFVGLSGFTVFTELPCQF